MIAPPTAQLIRALSQIGHITGRTAPVLSVPVLQICLDL